MISIPLDATAALHARFVIAPAVHAVDCLLAWLRPHRAPHASAWRAEVERAFDRGRIPLLHAMVTADTWLLPDFLMPPPGQDPVPAVRATDLDVVRFQLGLAFRSPLLGEPPAGLVDLATRRRPPLPEVLADAWTAGRFTDRVADELADFWDAVVEPHWPLVRGVLDEDILFRARRLADRGLVSVFDDLPESAWDKEVLRLRSPHEVDFAARWDHVLLVPAVFTWPQPTCVLHGEESISVVYPARGSAAVWSPPTHEPPDDRLLGPRRRRLLDDLAEPRSPHQLALRHDVSRATISYHLGVLREAGLVEAQRVGRLVYYRRTARADTFLA